MEYKVFLSCVRDCVASLCDDSDQVIIQKVMKNNSLELDGLIIQKESSTISPTIYLNSFYEDYQNGKSIGQITEEILKLDADNRFQFSFPVEQFCDFTQIQSKIVYKIVNTNRNRILLEKIPHRDFLDCSIIYYCYLEKINGSSATTLIYDSHLEKWDVTEEQLYAIATKNTPQIHPAELKSMDKILTELIMDGEFDQDAAMELEEEISHSENTMPMYVLTNKERIFGASCLMYPDVLQNFSSIYGSFYILPSSIHEVILVPDSNEIEAESLMEMVVEVNATQVAHDEVLSDSVYYYGMEQGSIRCVASREMMTQE